MANLNNLNQSDIEFLGEYLHFPDPAVVVQESIEHFIVPYQPGEIQLCVMDFNPPAEVVPAPTPDDLFIEQLSLLGINEPAVEVPAPMPDEEVEQPMEEDEALVKFYIYIFIQ